MRLVRIGPTLPAAHSTVPLHESPQLLPGDDNDPDIWNARAIHLLLRQGLLPMQLRLSRHRRLVLRQVHRLLRLQ